MWNQPQTWGRRFDLLIKKLTKNNGILKQSLDALVVPDPHVTSLYHARAPLSNSPQRFRNWCGIVQMHVGVGLLDSLRGNVGLVVGNRRIEVVGDVCRADLVVQKIDESPRIELVVRTIDRVQGTLYEGVVVV